MKRKHPGEIVSEVGRRIGELREEAGVTQSEFAERAGVGIRYVQRIEAGEINMTIRSLARFSFHLNVSIAELFRKPTTRRPARGRPPGR